MASTRFVKVFHPGSGYYIGDLEKQINQWVSNHKFKVIICHTSMCVSPDFEHSAMVTYYLEPKE